jgi:UDP-N-acetylglucosamine--N-acetylmuramyl-(pentapeptide) pyrophosphoryl-undecaprenol N-acetylglucosamine transferase
MVARFARACAVSYPGTPLPRARVTGNPVRPEVLAVDRSAGGPVSEARAALGLPVDRRVVGIFGGSLGALRINRAVLGALPGWTKRSDLAIHHVVGERDWELVTAETPPLPPEGGLHYQAVRYEDRLPLLYAAADLLVCRAGGNTVAELAAVGAPSILVPLPGAPADHQTANARVFANAGGAELVPDAELDGGTLAARVDALLGDPERLESMAKAAASLGRRDAADQVAALAEEHARD